MNRNEIDNKADWRPQLKRIVSLTVMIWRPAIAITGLLLVYLIQAFYNAIKEFFRAFVWVWQEGYFDNHSIDDISYGEVIKKGIKGWKNKYG